MLFPDIAFALSEDIDVLAEGVEGELKDAVGQILKKLKRNVDLTFTRSSTSTSRELSHHAMVAECKVKVAGLKGKALELKAQVEEQIVL